MKQNQRFGRTPVPAQIAGRDKTGGNHLSCSGKDKWVSVGLDRDQVW
jgi:hypothetical protein